MLVFIVFVFHRAEWGSDYSLRTVVLTAGVDVDVDVAIDGDKYLATDLDLGVFGI